MAIEGISSAVASYTASPAVARNAEVPKTKPAIPVEGTALNTENPEAAQALANGTAAVQETNQSDNKSDQQGSKDPQRQNEQLKKAVEQITKNANNTEAIYGIHDETDRVTIKIVNKETKDVIKEFPAEETLDMIAKAWELAGLMVDEKR
jgi:flagellar protein FlaG